MTDLDARAREFARRGYVTENGWNLPRLLDVIRETRRRMAGTKQDRATAPLAEFFVEKLVGDLPEVPPEHIGLVLMNAATKLSALAAEGVAPMHLCNVLGYAGYDLYTQAGTEQEGKRR